MSESLLAEIDRNLDEFRHRLQVRLRRRLRDALGEGVGGGAFRVVGELWRRGPVSPSELAGFLEVRTSTMAAHLDRLEELGWAQRECLPGTNRVRVLLTDPGRLAYERFVSLRRGVLEEALSPLTPEALAALGGALRAALGAVRGGADQSSEAN